jgi:hypothetical protein
MSNTITVTLLDHQYTRAVLAEWAFDSLADELAKEATKREQQGYKDEAELLFKASRLAKFYRDGQQNVSGYYAHKAQDNLTREAMSFIDKLAAII